MLNLKRISPNCLYVGDVVTADALDGQPFTGEIMEIHGSTIVLENHMGGSQWCKMRTVQTDRRTHKRVSDWQDKLRHDTRIT